ncbi:hypothetical protein [Novosphingobium mangrovi (ex Huang et al. 2023)]|uniref:UrcA family protein n=1 Tax=Novosphingobium mangrovi (ex Huang et al. 2023) TaxID=2976432 RepID=A0ABT2I4F8_9SPHN|nr:hypothetical protein [Novosphingobium mangrovi (ex Huang et al. 2023)]MCT2399670.1 hypothetical protein [Novosphingobium mangrovi (ex Huang et al. 2023)]
MHLVSRILVAAAVVVAVPAFAEPDSKASADAVSKTETAAAETENAVEKADPVICERIQQIGSLLRSKKVCMRKSQWDAQRSSDRANIERSQVQRGLDQAN